MTDETAPPEPEADLPVLLRWPPPGLERMQGDLWRVASRGALAGGILVLPLVFVVTGAQAFATLGPFADAWWVTLVLASVGLGFAIDTYASLGRMFKRIATSLEAGYDMRTVAYALADLRRDMGYLMQGKRHFSLLDRREREALAGLRVLAVSLFAAAGVWLPLAMGLMLLLVARGPGNPTAFWAVTLVPPVLAYVVGGVVSAAEDGRVRRARREWHGRPWTEDLASSEIEAWRALAGASDEATGLGRPNAPGAPRLRRASLLVGLLGAVAALPVLTLVPASALGPTLTRITVPRFQDLQRRAAEVEAFREYRVEQDSSVGPSEAGEILHALMYVGTNRDPAPGERAPASRAERPWLPALESGNPLGVEPNRWADELFARVAGGLDAPSRAYLAALAEHPAHADFARLARAPRLDAASARWDDPFPESINIATLPIPSVGVLRSGAYAHLGVAAHHLAAGRRAQAEQSIRETISVGFLLGDEGPTLLDNLVGHVIADAGGRALERYFEVVGRVDEAREVERLRATARRAADRIDTQAPAGVEALVRSLPAVVSDTTAVRGLRWEYFILTTTLTPCLNLHRMVFGPDADYERFLVRAHDALVRWPSEEELFRLARGGYWGAARDDSGGLIGRLLGVSMRGGEGSCGQVVRRLRALEEVL